MQPKVIILVFIVLLLSGCYLTTSRLALCGSKAVALVNDLLRFGQVNTQISGNFKVKTEYRYGSEPDQTLDLYAVNSTTQQTPTVMFIHGGYWRSGSKDDWTFLARAFNEQGYNVVIPNYRLVPEVYFPAFVSDAALAFKWITLHAPEFYGDPKNIFILGHSAGAHIASMLAFDGSYFHQIQAAAVVSIAGVYDLTKDDLRTDACIKDMLANNRPEDASPTHFISRTHPPYLAIYGRVDQVVNQNQIQRLEHELVSREADDRSQILGYDLDHLGLIFAFSPAFQTQSTLFVDVMQFLKLHHNM
jgi:acetyl esterase/lipase